MRVFYTPHYYAEIGDGHIFPIRKFQYVRDRLLAEGTLKSDHFSEPTPAAIEEVLLVHTEDYVSRLCTGTLNAKELRRLGLPWSQSLVQRSFFATGGTICAAREALETGVASNLAGGTHHAFPDHGEGFCVLNDVAVAIEVLRREQLAWRFAVIDCDVHQGNGTANIFEQDESVFTFSMHGAKNYPLFKARSTLDVELPDGTGDHQYLELLDANLAAVFAHDPQIVFYLGGADPFVGDKLGRLSLTIEGLKKRDRRVLNECFEREVPVATVMSGGYGEHLEDTIEIHCNTIRSVMAVFGGTEGPQVKLGRPVV
jgi:acetoin utilization deacetylase AcuC-like enzyme